MLWRNVQATASLCPAAWAAASSNHDSLLYVAAGQPHLQPPHAGLAYVFLLTFVHPESYEFVEQRILLMKTYPTKALLKEVRIVL